MPGLTKRLILAVRGIFHDNWRTGDQIVHHVAAAHVGFWAGTDDPVSHPSHRSLSTANHLVSELGFATSRILQASV
jgi:hypothetical protein